MNSPRIFVASLILGAVLPVTAAELPAVPRFSAGHMDTSVDPRADFARYAFGNWQKANPIPADQSSWGSFSELRFYNRTALKGILDTVSSRSHAPGSVEQKVGDFYASALDTAAIEAAGLQPIAAMLAQVAGIASSADLARTLADLHDCGVNGLFFITVVPDAKQSNVNALLARPPGIMLPSRDYYLEERHAKARAAFLAHMEKIFVLAGDTPEAAAANAKTVFDVNAALATGTKSPVELRDRLANYNKMPTADLAAKFPVFPLPVYLAQRGIVGAAAAEIIVSEPTFFEGLQAQLAARPLGDWKTYLRFSVLGRAAPALPEAFAAESFRFRSTELRGTPAQEPRWQIAARVVDDKIGEALGQLYVARYYPPEAKARMAELIKNISAVMRDRLGQLEWMTEPTRQKALAKFNQFHAKIGYPDQWKDYTAVEIRRDAYCANIMSADRAEIRRNLAKLGQPVDRTEWNTTPPTVNAFFSATNNSITFPAGILQPPFFDLTLDDAVNYGAIGVAIGHEITHGFDDQGRRSDGNGNLVNWWAPEDAKEFEARAQKLVDQFNAYEVLPGVRVNGRLTLGENIADLGGVTLAYEALQRSLVGKERKLIDGFTPEQRFFLSFAQLWRTHYRENAMKRYVEVDNHSPAKFRAIGALVNFQPFYDAFGIKEGDPIWVPVEKRAKIW